jgi:septal ring factor EnvC (AmiA/AmiB activator)
MRNTLLSSVAWLGALQAFLAWGAPAWALATAVPLIGVAGVLGTLTVLVYRLGVWRQDFENTKDKVAAEVKALREESAAAFDRIERRLEAIERRLEAIDHVLTMLSDHLARASRRQSRTNRRLARLEDDRSPYAEAVS